MFTFAINDTSKHRTLALSGVLLGALLAGCGGSSSSSSTGKPPAGPDPDTSPEPSLVISEENAHRVAFAALSSYFMAASLPDNILGGIEFLLEEDICPDNTVNRENDVLTAAFVDCQDEEGMHYTGSIVVQDLTPSERLFQIDDYSMFLYQEFGPDMFLSLDFYGDGELRLEEWSEHPYQGQLSAQALRYGIAFEMAFPPTPIKDAVEVLLHDLTLEFEGYANEPHTTQPNGLFALVSEGEAAYVLQETTAPLAFSNVQCIASGTTELTGGEGTTMSIHGAAENEVVITINGHALAPMTCDELEEWLDVPGGNA